MPCTGSGLDSLDSSESGLGDLVNSCSNTEEDNGLGVTGREASFSWAMSRGKAGSTEGLEDRSTGRGVPLTAVERGASTSMPSGRCSVGGGDGLGSADPDEGRTLFTTSGLGTLV